MASQSATRYNMAAADAKLPRSVIKLPGSIGRDSSNFGLKSHKDFGVRFGESRLQFRESPRLHISKDFVIPAFRDEKYKFRPSEPLTPQNSILSEANLSEKSVKDQSYLAGVSYKPEQRIKKADEPKLFKMKPQQTEPGAERTNNAEKFAPINKNSGLSFPQHKDPLKRTHEKGKKSVQLNMRPLRWSTSSLGASKHAKLGDIPNDGGRVRVGQRGASMGLQSDITFSAYDFYNKHNSGQWFSSSVVKENHRESKLAGFRQAMKRYSHGNVNELVNDWAQEAYKTRFLHMLLSEVEKEEEEEDEPVAPLLVHLKKQAAAAEPLPAIFNPMRRNSLPPRAARKSSVFYALPSFDHLPEQERLRRRKIRNFRWYSHLIRAMVRLSANMTQLSRDKTHNSAYSEFLYILAGARTHAGQEGLPGEEGGGRGDKGGEPQLLFDKSWFSRGRA
ncbi:hypothetical protein PoB_005601100, partial [Plakobranchus ocellatus]